MLESRPPAVHSVAGSGFGFGMAGSAAGLFAGLVWYAAEVAPLPPEVRVGLPTGACYPYILLCIPVGFVLGVAAGMEYARRSHRASRRVSHHVEPGRVLPGEDV